MIDLTEGDEDREESSYTDLAKYPAWVLPLIRSYLTEHESYARQHLPEMEYVTVPI